ncbi:MAG: phospholipase D-like domain-containing protein [Rhodospirillales bacterium]|nr:phospholipase D-like domain-containing protein [Rhodospirillales bacterium]
MTSEVMGGLLADSAPVLLAAVQVLLAVLASGHVILFKRGVHAAIGWVALIWLVPFGGAVLYLLLGINRVRRRAAGLRARPSPRIGAPPPVGPPPAAAADWLPPGLAHLAAVARILDTVAGLPLTAGNAVQPLAGGSAAYAAMLAAIGAAERSIGLSSYIFDNDAVGHRFVDALAAARGRGVAVRVLVDGVGARYSYPPIIDRLRRAGVRAEDYFPPLVPLRLQYANLRNHRKILIIDGRVGFTGGMNLRASHLDDAPAASAVRDLHFRIEGPVVGHLAATFIDDWRYAAGEVLAGDAWSTRTQVAGAVFARGIASGPDEDFERVRWAMVSAVIHARRRIRVVTPYFLPDATLAMLLQHAAMRGVAVEILIPERSNLKLVEWASLARIGALVVRGCRVWRSPPPFDHAKMMTVDGGFALLGSANWDPRSMRLNFEFNVECYDETLVAGLDALFDERLAAARPLDLATLASRPLLARLRDGAAWLASPYL